MKTVLLLIAVALWRGQLPPKSSPCRRRSRLACLGRNLKSSLPPAVHIDGWIGKRIDANVRAGCCRSTLSRCWPGIVIGPEAILGSGSTSASGCTRPLWPGRTRAIRCCDSRSIVSPRSSVQLRGSRTAILAPTCPRSGLASSPATTGMFWSHKYNLIGLLTYYQYTGDTAALQACRKMGDLLIATFPEKKSILAAGTHKGMAATSVLEPIVLLYRTTGDKRYLDFAHYIVRSWDEPGGPKVLTTLLSEKQVNKTANGKAYEMLSNLVGLCELYRATGDAQLLASRPQRLARHRREPALHYRQPPVRPEHFHGDHELPNGPERQHLRNVRYRHLDAAQLAIAAADRRGEVRRRIRAIALQPLGRRPESAR